MELQIIKKETIGAGTTAIPDNEIIAKYEIMDGGPIKSKFYFNYNYKMRLFQLGSSFLLMSYPHHMPI